MVWQIAKVGTWSRAGRRPGALPHRALHHALHATLWPGGLNPNRLVFLLDHEYTQQGLSWNRLKGADAERAALLRAAAERAAAERAGCEAVLALSEVTETWDAWRSDGEPWDDYDYHDEEG